MFGGDGDQGAASLKLWFLDQSNDIAAEAGEL